MTLVSSFRSQFVAHICVVIFLLDMAFAYQLINIFKLRVNVHQHDASLLFRKPMLVFHGPPNAVQDTAKNTEPKAYSFVNDELRPYAMKLHTKDQAPKEGQQKSQTPFTKWTPSRQDYLQFLAESLVTYEAFESITHQYTVLAPLRTTGLERVNALKEDIEWMLQYDKTLTRPLQTNYGKAYAKFLEETAKVSIPRFLCHYYNHYFAHTAGGRMIGAKMAELLLDKKVLKFYQWEVPDVKVLIDETKKKIDVIASTWSDAEKKQCLEETMATFTYGGSLMSSMKPPTH